MYLLEVRVLIRIHSLELRINKGLEKLFELVQSFRYSSWHRPGFGVSSLIRGIIFLTLMQIYVYFAQFSTL